MKNSFQNAKYAFVDSINKNFIIDTQTFFVASEQLEKIILEPIYFSLCVGESGAGKSILLYSVYKKYQHQKDIYYFKYPFFNEDDFLEAISMILKGEKSDVKATFDGLMSNCYALYGKKEFIVFLDESHLLSNTILEFVRILSDTKVIKFVLSIHELKNLDLLSTSYFKTRICNKIELGNMNKQEMTSYVHTRLLEHGISDVVSKMNDGELRLIYKYSDGNYRKCNNLMYTIFDLSHHNNIFDKKIIELAAIKLGLTDA